MKEPSLTLTGRLRWDVVCRCLEDIETVETVLEVGAGLGSFGARLATRYDYTGLEPDDRSARVARERVESFGGTLVEGTVADLPPRLRFDMVCAFEVLEHIEDDLKALRLWRDRLENGGWLLLSVPAFQSRFGAWDEHAGHFRRYDPDEIEPLLREAGFEVRSLQTYGWPLGNMSERIRHWIAGRRPVKGGLRERTARSGRALQPGPITGRLLAVVTGPFCWLQRRIGSGRGVGIVVAARREGGS